MQSKRAFIRVSGMRQLTAGFLVIALAVAACTEATPTPRVSQAAGLPTGSTFVAAAVKDRPLVKGTQVRLEFLLEGLRVHAGCNTLYADADLEGDRLQVSGVRGTRMTCLRTLRKQEEWLAAFLAKAPRMQLSDDELTLTAGREQITFTSVERDEPDRPLRRTHWAVDTLIGGDKTSSIPAGVHAHVWFSSDGRASGHNGCNTFRRGYKQRKRELIFSGRMYQTAMYCDGPKGEVERAVSGFLFGRTVAYQIDGAKLTLTAGKRKVVFKAIDVAAPDRTLRRTHWRLDTVSSGDTTMPLRSGVRAYVRFGPDGKVTGNSGCNAFSGYFWQREDLDFHIHGGAMRCDEARTQVEDLVRGVLNEELVFKIDGATLTLTVGDRWLRFIAGESPGPDRPLHGTHWQIDTLIDGTVSPIPRGVKAHIRSVPTDGSTAPPAATGSAGASRSARTASPSVGSTPR